MPWRLFLPTSPPGGGLHRFLSSNRFWAAGSGGKAAEWNPAVARADCWGAIVGYRRDGLFGTLAGAVGQSLMAVAMVTLGLL